MVTVCWALFLSLFESSISKVGRFERLYVNPELVIFSELVNHSRSDLVQLAFGIRQHRKNNYGSWSPSIAIFDLRCLERGAGSNYL